MEISKKGLAEYLRILPHKGAIIVSPARKMLYLKSCKTAGTSILRSKVGLDAKVPDLLFRSKNKDDFFNWLNNITDEDLEDYFVFSVVRNPWDRVVSLAHYFAIPVEELLDNWTDYMAVDRDLWIHSYPLHYYTHISNSQYCDYICRFENIQSDIDYIFERIDIPKAKLPKLITTERGPYRDYFSESYVEKVNKIYRRDIELFDYTF